MSIAQYNKKRNFKKTREPKGKLKVQQANGKQKLHFVIHEHDASHHHFDLRLEYNGVLKSWALPKTISTDPSVKRLAVEVEDHPISYASFKGSIPEGEYGAGVVDIWDEGIWSNESTISIEASFKKGHLHFKLAGQKLKSVFHLVRTKKTNQWLLFAASEQSSSNALQPQLAQSATRIALPSYVEPKLDGYRIIASKNEAGQILLTTRNGLNWTAKFDTIALALSKLPLHSFIFDGELTFKDGRGLTFHDLQKSIETGHNQNIRYQIFDILSFDQRDTTPLSLTERKKLLDRIAPYLLEPLLPVYYELIKDASSIKDFVSKMRAENYEGIISKNPDGTYLSGQRRDWYKIKWQKNEEFVVVGYTFEKESRDSIGALLVAEVIEGRLYYRGKVGTGFSTQERKRILKQLDKDKISPEQANSQFTNGPKFKYTSVRPTYYIQIQYQNLTPSQRLRAPVFMGFREDKIFEAPLEISNPDKKYFADGTTKLSLYKYYDRLGSLLTPFLIGQTLSLLRCPEGAQSQCFFQKNQQQSNQSKLIRIKNSTDLLKWVQQGTVEFHIQSKGSKTTIDHMVFDLDPGPKVTYADLKKVTRLLHTTLEQLKLPVFLKTSGRKGFHLCIPLKKGLTAQKIESFSRLISLHVEKVKPQLISTKLQKKERENKVFIDYLRNKKSATFVAPYSVRQNSQPTISAPLSWEDFQSSRHLPTITIYDDIDTIVWNSYFDSAVDLKSLLHAEITDLTVAD